MSLKNYSRYGVTYFQLYISCPVCNNEGRNTPHSYWSHDVDGGDVYVVDDATYQCKQCGHTRHVSDWEYGCPRHSGGSDEYVYKKSTIASIASVISCAGQMVSETGLPWLRVFMENLEKGWDNARGETESMTKEGRKQKRISEMIFINLDGYVSCRAGVEINDELIIPSEIEGEHFTGIDSFAFGFQTMMSSVVIPNSIQKIGHAAFYECKKLCSILIPEKDMTDRELSAYREGLTSLVLPHSVTVIEDSTFSECVSLKRIIIPSSVTRICDHAFSYCEGLISLTIPNTVKEIEDGAFRGCNNLKIVAIGHRNYDRIECDIPSTASIVFLD